LPREAEMRNWLTRAQRQWDAILAGTLSFAAIGVWLGPGYFFLAAWLLGSLYVLKVALETPGRPPNRG